MRLGGELISKTSSCIRSIEQYFCVTSGSSDLGRQGAEQGGGGGGGTVALPVVAIYLFCFPVKKGLVTALKFSVMFPSNCYITFPNRYL